MPPRKKAPVSPLAPYSATAGSQPQLYSESEDELVQRLLGGPPSATPSASASLAPVPRALGATGVPRSAPAPDLTEPAPIVPKPGVVPWAPKRGLVDEINTSVGQANDFLGKQLDVTRLEDGTKDGMMVPLPRGFTSLGRGALDATLGLSELVAKGPTFIRNQITGEDATHDNTNMVSRGIGTLRANLPKLKDETTGDRLVQVAGGFLGAGGAISKYTGAVRAAAEGGALAIKWPAVAAAIRAVAGGAGSSVVRQTVGNTALLSPLLVGSAADKETSLAGNIAGGFGGTFKPADPGSPMARIADNPLARGAFEVAADAGLGLGIDAITGRLRGASPAAGGASAPAPAAPVAQEAPALKQLGAGELPQQGQVRGLLPAGPIITPPPIDPTGANSYRVPDPPGSVAASAGKLVPSASAAAAKLPESASPEITQALAALLDQKATPTTQYAERIGPRFIKKVPKGEKYALDLARQERNPDFQGPIRPSQDVLPASQDLNPMYRPATQDMEIPSFPDPVPRRPERTRKMEPEPGNVLPDVVTKVVQGEDGRTYEVPVHAMREIVVTPAEARATPSTLADPGPSLGPSIVPAEAPLSGRPFPQTAPTREEAGLTPLPQREDFGPTAVEQPQDLLTVPEVRAAARDFLQAQAKRAEMERNGLSGDNIAPYEQAQAGAYKRLVAAAGEAGITAKKARVAELDPKTMRLKANEVVQRPVSRDLINHVLDDEGLRREAGVAKIDPEAIDTQTYSDRSAPVMSKLGVKGLSEDVEPGEFPAPKDNIMERVRNDPRNDVPLPDATVEPPKPTVFYGASSQKKVLADMGATFTKADANKAVVDFGDGVQHTLSRSGREWSHTSSYDPKVGDDGWSAGELGNTKEGAAIRLADQLGKPLPDGISVDEAGRIVRAAPAVAVPEPAPVPKPKAPLGAEPVVAGEVFSGGKTEGFTPKLGSGWQELDTRVRRAMTSDLSGNPEHDMVTQATREITKDPSVKVATVQGKGLWNGQLSPNATETVTAASPSMLDRAASLVLSMRGLLTGQEGMVSFRRAGIEDAAREKFGLLTVRVPGGFAEDEMQHLTATAKDWLAHRGITDDAAMHAVSSATPMKDPNGETVLVFANTFKQGWSGDQLAVDDATVKEVLEQALQTEEYHGGEVIHEPTAAVAEFGFGHQDYLAKIESAIRESKGGATAFRDFVDRAFPAVKREYVAASPDKAQTAARIDQRHALARGIARRLIQQGLPVAGVATASAIASTDAQAQSADGSPEDGESMLWKGLAAAGVGALAYTMYRQHQGAGATMTLKRATESILEGVTQEAEAAVAAKGGSPRVPGPREADFPINPRENTPARPDQYNIKRLGLPVALESELSSRIAGAEASRRSVVSDQETIKKSAALLRLKPESFQKIVDRTRVPDGETVLALASIAKDRLERIARISDKLKTEGATLPQAVQDNLKAEMLRLGDEANAATGSWIRGSSEQGRALRANQIVAQQVNSPAYWQARATKVAGRDLSVDEMIDLTKLAESGDHVALINKMNVLREEPVPMQLARILRAGMLTRPSGREKDVISSLGNSLFVQKGLAPMRAAFDELVGKGVAAGLGLKVGSYRTSSNPQLPFAGRPLSGSFTGRLQTGLADAASSMGVQDAKAALAKGGSARDAAVAMIEKLRSADIDPSMTLRQESPVMSRIRMFSDPKDYETGVLGGSKRAKLDGVLDLYVQTMGKATGIADRIVKATAYDVALEDHALAMASREGHSGAAVQARAKEIIANPPEQLVARALEDTEALTFINQGVLAGTISKLRGAPGKAYQEYAARKGYDPKGTSQTKSVIDAAMMMVAPFVTVPANITSKAIDYSPLGALRAGSEGVQLWRAVDRAKASVENGVLSEKDALEVLSRQRKFVEKLTMTTAGTFGLMSLGFMLAKEGAMVGAYPKRNPKESASRGIDGAGSNAILIGGEWRPITWLGPQGLILAMGATLHEMSASAPAEGDYTSRANDVLEAAGRTALDQPFVQGASGAANLLTGSTDEKSRFLVQQSGALIPSAVGAMAQGSDGIRRKPETVEQMLDSKTPGRQDRVPAARTQLGDEARAPKGVANQLFNPFAGVADGRGRRGISLDGVDMRPGVSGPRNRAAEVLNSTVDPDDPSKAIMPALPARQPGESAAEYAKRLTARGARIRASLDRFADVDSTRRNPLEVEKALNDASRDPDARAKAARRKAARAALVPR